MYRDNRPGCLMGLLQLFLLDKLFGWLQRGIGFGSGSVLGCGCGPILFGHLRVDGLRHFLQHQLAKVVCAISRWIWFDPRNAMGGTSGKMAAY